MPKSYENWSNQRLVKELTHRAFCDGQSQVELKMKDVVPHPEVEAMKKAVLKRMGKTRNNRPTKR